MAASTSPARRKRYLRTTPPTPLVLSEPKRRLLESVAEYRLVSLPQLAQRTDLPLKSARRYMRQLFDHGLVDVVAVPRLALAECDMNDATLLFGSAPNIYVLSKRGAKVLERDGFLQHSPRITTYGPRNFVYLAHELQIRSIRLWFERLARTCDEFQLERWEDGAEAELPLGEGPNDGAVRPDAWCAFRFGRRVMIGLIEVDRGTERGDARWQQKIEGYGRLLGGPALLRSTGYSKARVLTITPNLRRRDQLADLVTNRAPAELSDRFWFVARDELEGTSLTDPRWRRAGMPELCQLVSQDQLIDALQPRSPERITGQSVHRRRDVGRLNERSG